MKSFISLLPIFLLFSLQLPALAQANCQQLNESDGDSDHYEACLLFARILSSDSVSDLEGACTSDLLCKRVGNCPLKKECHQLSSFLTGDRTEFWQRLVKSGPCEQGSPSTSEILCQAIHQASASGFGHRLIDSLMDHPSLGSGLSTGAMPRTTTKERFDHFPKVLRERILKKGESYTNNFLLLMERHPHIFLPYGLFKDTDIVGSANDAFLDNYRGINRIGPEVFNQHVDHDITDFGIELECHHLIWQLSRAELDDLSLICGISDTYSLVLASTTGEEKIPDMSVTLEEYQDGRNPYVEFVTGPLTLNKKGLGLENAAAFIDDLMKVIVSDETNSIEGIIEAFGRDGDRHLHHWNFPLKEKIEGLEARVGADGRIDRIKLDAPKDESYFQGKKSEIETEKRALSEERQAARGQAGLLTSLKEREGLLEIREKVLEAERRVFDMRGRGLLLSPHDDAYCTPQLNLGFELDMIYTNPSLFKSMLGMSKINLTEDFATYDLARAMVKRLLENKMHASPLGLVELDERNYAAGMLTLALYQAISRAYYISAERKVNKNALTALLKIPVSDLPRLPGIRDGERTVFLQLLRDLMGPANQGGKGGIELLVSDAESRLNAISPQPMPVHELSSSLRSQLQSWFLSDDDFSARYKQNNLRDAKGEVINYRPLEAPQMKVEATHVPGLPMEVEKPVWISMKDERVRVLIEQRVDNAPLLTAPPFTSLVIGPRTY